MLEVSLSRVSRHKLAEIGYNDSDDGRDADLSSTECEEADNQASFAQPPIVQPDIDIELIEASAST
ncbi:protein phosphatase 1 regulatory subunit 3A-like [Pimephales promelas]|nr:protein phosphatase 1 regulatory subunit 3A-like [Pimephales promelas]